MAKRVIKKDPGLRINNGNPTSPQLIAGLIIGGFVCYQILKRK